MDRLQQQIEFIVEIDKLKGVLRRSPLINEDRRENSGEHSWHLAMLALVLVEHSNVPVDLLKVLKMLLIHDIVERERAEIDRILRKSAGSIEISIAGKRLEIGLAPVTITTLPLRSITDRTPAF